MMKDKDASIFWKAMGQEFESMIKNKIFETYPKDKLPWDKVRNAPQRVLQAIWSFRKKTTPAGEVYRHRSRLCVHGGQQTEGVDFTKHSHQL